MLGMSIGSQKLCNYLVGSMSTLHSSVDLLPDDVPTDQCSVPGHCSIAAVDFAKATRSTRIVQLGV